jgi:hypothetical protein
MHCRSSLDDRAADFTELLYETLAAVGQLQPYRDHFSDLTNWSWILRIVPCRYNEEKPPKALNLEDLERSKGAQTN